jgi:hypothetical protein
MHASCTDVIIRQDSWRCKSTGCLINDLTLRSIVAVAYPGETVEEYRYDGEYIILEEESSGTDH